MEVIGIWQNVKLLHSLELKVIDFDFHYEDGYTDKSVENLF